MFVASLVIVVAMVAASGVAALVLPPHGMLPMDLGPGSGLRWLPKEVALVLWPALGVVSYLVARLSAALGEMRSGSEVGLTIALLVLLLAQGGSILVAINRGGRA